ncbi:hypothetical protein VM636_09130 [Streptomyces sp. SCSIO 75703]|uniref:hypothetical protein n=1 Tax=unclassified Streptomyces TaxID=2593676 RepID=UPI0004C16610|nr:MULTISPECIES: hypothetical protein [unclassified Streptomyces]
MRVVIVWWDLGRSEQTIASLRAFLRDEAVDRYARMPGLRLKVWIADETTDRWGAVFLWESARAAEAPLPPGAAALIGYAPTERYAFDVEATTEGAYDTAGLARLGRAFTG